MNFPFDDKVAWCWFWIQVSGQYTWLSKVTLVVSKRFFVRCSSVMNERCALERHKRSTILIAPSCPCLVFPPEKKTPIMVKGNKTQSYNYGRQMTLGDINKPLSLRQTIISNSLSVECRELGNCLIQKRIIVGLNLQIPSSSVFKVLWFSHL